MSLDLRFLTKNDHKFEEFRKLFKGTNLIRPH
jgi:inosine/xanthosine triphosphate pyrophosphatase family protein